MKVAVTCNSCKVDWGYWLRFGEIHWVEKSEREEHAIYKSFIHAWTALLDRLKLEKWEKGQSVGSIASNLHAYHLHRAHLKTQQRSPLISRDPCTRLPAPRFGIIAVLKGRSISVVTGRSCGDWSPAELCRLQYLHALTEVLRVFECLDVLPSQPFS